MHFSFISSFLYQSSILLFAFQMKPRSTMGNVRKLGLHVLDSSTEKLQVFFYKYWLNYHFPYWCRAGWQYIWRMKSHKYGGAPYPAGVIYTILLAPWKSKEIISQIAAEPCTTAHGGVPCEWCTTHHCTCTWCTTHHASGGGPCCWFTMHINLFQNNKMRGKKCSPSMLDFTL